MPRNSVTLERADLGNLSPNAIGVDGIRALSAIQGVEDPQIERETKDQVDISYVWAGAEKFLTTQEHLAQFGLQRVY